MTKFEHGKNWGLCCSLFMQALQGATFISIEKQKAIVCDQYNTSESGEWTNLISAKEVFHDHLKSLADESLSKSLLVANTAEKKINCSV